MKILIFSDIHGNSYVLKDLQNSINQYVPDKIIFLGDIFGYFYNYLEIIEFLYKNNVICILGNHDANVLKLLYSSDPDLNYFTQKYGNSYNNLFQHKRIITNFLNDLPRSISLQINKNKYLFIHGDLNDHTNGRIYKNTFIDDNLNIDYNLVFCGHTHQRFVKFLNYFNIINVGSIGMPRDGQKPCFVTYDTIFNVLNYHELEYHLDILIKDIDRNNDINKPYVKNLLSLIL